MRAVVYKGNGQIALEDRPMPVIMNERDAIIEVTLTTICSSDIHIKHGAVPKAVPGTVLGHEFVGRVTQTGSAVKKETQAPLLLLPAEIHRHDVGSLLIGDRQAQAVAGLQNAQKALMILHLSLAASHRLFVSCFRL